MSSVLGHLKSQFLFKLAAQYAGMGSMHTSAPNRSRLFGSA